MPYSPRVGGATTPPVRSSSLAAENKPVNTSSAPGQSRPHSVEGGTPPPRQDNPFTKIQRPASAAGGPLPLPIWQIVDNYETLRLTDPELDLGRLNAAEIEKSIPELEERVEQIALEAEEYRASQRENKRVRDELTSTLAELAARPKHTPEYRAERDRKHDELKQTEQRLQQQVQRQTDIIDERKAKQDELQARLHQASEQLQQVQAQLKAAQTQAEELEGELNVAHMKAFRTVLEARRTERALPVLTERVAVLKKLLETVEERMEEKLVTDYEDKTLAEVKILDEKIKAEEEKRDALSKKITDNAFRLPPHPDLANEYTLQMVASADVSHTTAATVTSEAAGLQKKISEEDTKLEKLAQWIASARQRIADKRDKATAPDAA